MGKIKLKLIKNTYYTSLLLQVNPVNIKTISNLTLCHLLNFKKKKINDNTDKVINLKSNKPLTKENIFN